MLSFRHIHLDYHTSPLISDLAVDFDPAAFVDTLKRANVNSVTCFAKCHHGMSYYPTDVGVRHPGLRRDLLGEQIAACHAQGIKAPIYLSVVWDEHAAAQHADWLQVAPDGRLAGRQPFAPHGWRYLCMNSPYLDYVAAQTEELLQRYPVDGFFFDIVMETFPACVCNHCMRLMEQRGLDPTSPVALRQKANLVGRKAMDRLSTLVRRHQPDATIFYNSRLRLGAVPEAGSKPELAQITHVEIESLPSGGWGYNHFPLYARYFSSLGLPMLGMTARFHKTWADFGGIKSVAALDYECFRMLSMGAACSIGDQLHPRGTLEKPVYERIGALYERVQRYEPFVADATPLADIGVLLTTPPDSPGGQVNATDQGALRMLLECQAQFAFIDREAALERFKLIIAPDVVRFDPDLAAKIAAYLAQGGRLLLSHHAGLQTDTDTFALAELGVSYQGVAPTTPAYLRLDSAFAAAAATPIPAIDHVLYDESLAVLPAPGADALGSIVASYFDRTWRSFSSHNQTPPDALTPFAGIVRHGSVIYIAHPLFRAYYQHGAPVYRQIVAAALQLLLPHPLIRATLPTTAEVSVLQQGNRYSIHLLHYVPQRRAPDLDLVEDALPIAPTTLALRVPVAPQRAYLAPDGPALATTYADGYAQITLPMIIGHAIIVVDLT